MKDIKAVVLAAGKGTRMNSALPKVLHEIHGKSLLDRVISSLKNAGIQDIIVVVGHKKELIINECSKKGIRFVEQKQILGTGDALKVVENEIGHFGGDVLVTCGDTPLISSSAYRRLLDKHKEEKAFTTILSCDINDPFSYGRICRDPNGDIVGIVEEKDASPEEKEINEINTGTYCFRCKDLWEKIDSIEFNQKKKEFYLTDIIKISFSAHEKISSSGCGVDEAIGINSRNDLAKAGKIMNDKKLDILMDEGVTIIDPGTTWIHDDVSVGKDTVIYPNTVIEDDVSIGKGCKIGPFARIRPGSRLADDVEIGNFVEVNRTSIEEGTKVKHHTYLGDAVLGRNVNIGAGTITANYDGEKKHRTIIKDSVFVGVGAVLIAPVEIGKGAKIGAGSVVTKNKNVPEGVTVVGVPAKPFSKQG